MKTRSLPPSFGVLAISLSVLAATDRASGQSFKGLGFLPGTNYSEGLKVSRDGKVAVGRCGGYPVIWSELDGTLMRIGGANGPSGAANSVNSDGTVVVGQYVDASTHYRAFRWTHGSDALQDLGTLGGYEARAFDVSHDGSIVVGYSTLVLGQNRRAFKWTEGPQGGTLINLGTSAGVDYSEAYGVSGDGTTIVGRSQTACRWTQSGSIQSVPLTSVQTCSRTGAILGGNISPGGNPGYMAKYAVGGMPITLGGDPASDARDTNDDGSVIVGVETSNPGSSNNNPHAVMWSVALGSVVDLNDYLPTLGVNLTGWTLRFANGVSGDGRIVVGTGHDPEGHSQAWRAVLPCSAISLIMGDVNDDGHVNGLDIPLFVDLVGAIDTHSRDFCAADLNHDGIVDSTDVPMFLNSLLGP